MSDLPEMPPLDLAALEPPPDDSFFTGEDPFPDDLFAGVPPDDMNPDEGYDVDLATDPFQPPMDGDRDRPVDAPDPSQPGGSELPQPEDESWSWDDARLIAVDRGEEGGSQRYEIGCMDVYHDLEAGDLGASYLPVAAFGDETVATAFYHDLQREIHDQGLSNADLPDFAGQKAAALNPESQWRGAVPEEYTAYQYLRDLEALNRTLPLDTPPDPDQQVFFQAALDAGGAAAREIEAPSTEEVADDRAMFNALNAIGIEAESFDPAKDPPPFYDQATGTAYWVGVFQPDREDRENCVASILSLGRHPETGEMQAQLAPCVPGDWDKSYGAAEYLIQVAQKGGIEQCFDAAEGMALAADQRRLWETERGLALDQEATRDLADYTAQNWEMDL